MSYYPGENDRIGAWIVREENEFNAFITFQRNWRA